MKLMVTGGAGFIGSNFILYWIKKYPEDHIVNFDTLTYAGNLDNLKDVETSTSYSFVKGDILDAEQVDKIVKDVDIIVHFAAESHVDRSIKDPASFLKTNVLGTQVLLDSALRNGSKRFHHISTDEVFGSLDLESKDKFKENTSYSPRSPYAASKASSDHLVRAYYHTYGLPVTLTNCSNNFGPFQFPEKLIPLAITNLIDNKKVPVYGDGLNVRDWLYVEDHVYAVDLVIKNGKIGETYLIGGMDTDVSNIDIVRQILKFMGKDESYIEFVTDRPGHDRKYSVDWTKINQKLGWKPAYDFNAWLEKTVAWYKENESWWRKIKSGEYLKYYEEQYGKAL